MLDIKEIRENTQYVKDALATVGDMDSVDRLLEADEKRRTLLSELESLRNTRNSVSKEIGKTKDAAERQKKIDSMKEVNDRIKELEGEEVQTEESFRALSL